MKPILIQPAEIEKFKTEHPELIIVDRYDEQIEEIVQLRNPQLRFDSQFQATKPAQIEGSWFYFPWRNTLIHFLPEDMHTELRTGRNRNLITADEQRIYYNATIAVLGMSVGSHAAITLTMNGGPKHIKLADMDTISGSNTNRIRTGFHDIGTPKVVSVARQIYEINPYAVITIYDKGVTEENLESIITDPKIDVLIEEMDNPYFKFKAREYCKKYQTPLVSAADNGDGVIAHVERYDSEKSQQFFNGLMGSMIAEDVKKLDKKQIIGVVARTVGADRSVLRMQESVIEVGRTLYSWPQLGTAANMCGTVLTYLARRIILGEAKIKSGIYDVSMDAIFEDGWHSPEVVNDRKSRTTDFLKKLGL